MHLNIIIDSHFRLHATYINIGKRLQARVLKATNVVDFEFRTLRPLTITELIENLLSNQLINQL